MKLPTGQIHYILPGFIFKGTLLLSAYHKWFPGKLSGLLQLSAS